MKRDKLLIRIATLILLIAVFLVVMKRDIGNLGKDSSKQAQRHKPDCIFTESEVRSRSRRMTRNVRYAVEPSFGIAHAQILLEAGVTRNDFLIWVRSKPALSGGGYEQYQLEDGQVSMTISTKDNSSIESWYIVNNRAEQVASSDR